MGKEGAPFGNQNAVKKNRIFANTLRRVLVQGETEIEPGMSRLKKICIAAIEKAENGDIPAFREIRDTLDGRPAQSINVGGQDDDGDPVSGIAVRLIGGAGNKSP